ncbi:O-antigen ligase [uncultured Megasphaera sp.]|uniref:O-antigen ligase family protein n=1 Tax=uncultured Megasphaera sp. TaxID=165188 RepID=UPI00265B5887|nr:O-antigen ligase family protein [uncultured Megasphaera sp.]
MNRVIHHYQHSSPSEQARLRVVAALVGTVFCMPLQLIVMEVCFLIALGLAAYYIWKYGGPPFSCTGLTVPALGFFAASLLSLAGSPHALMGAAFHAFTVLQYLLLYMLISHFLQGRAERRLVIHVLLISACVVALYGLYQYAHMLTLHEVEWVDSEAFPLLQRRMYSTLYNPNLLSAFLLMVMSIAAAMTIWSRHRGHRWMYGIVFAVLTLCLVLTYSRGAWLSAAGLVFFFGLIWDKRLWFSFLSVPAVLLFYHGGVARRLLSIFSRSEADTSVAMRLDMWEGAIAMFGDHPVLGIGWGAFKYVYPMYNEFIQQAGITIYHAHNMYLNILAETGVIGFFFAMWFFFGTFWYAWRVVRQKQTERFDRATAAFVCAAIVSQAICGVSDYDLFSTQISLVFWLFCALFSNMYAEQQKNMKKSLRNNSQ